MEPPDLDQLPADLKAVLDDFTASADRIFLPYIEAIEAQTPPPIFHYTREEGLKGILSSGTIRLTDAFQLNDPSELTHGLHILDQIFERRAAKDEPLGVFGARMREFVRRGGVQQTAHYFVGSFSQLGDDLPQWRSYADDARGFALEFDAGILEREVTKREDASTWRTTTFPVSYEDSEIITLFGGLVELVAPLILLPMSRAMTNEERRAYIYDLELRFTLLALHRNVFFKHPAYRSELEYRFLQIHQAFVGTKIEVGLKQRGNETVRFRELNWLADAPGSLKAVIIGPASRGLPGPRLRAREWLDAAGLRGVPIRDSELPYRAFDAPCPSSGTSTPRAP